jgi:MSHA pilin protein MshD
LAIAESLLEEIELMPFTFCDPDDTNAAAATSTASCTTVEGTGPEAGETRYSAPQFDNVNDYDGFTMTGIRDVSGAAVAGLGSYNATVRVTPTALGSVPASDSLLIQVTVTGPSARATVTLEGYRTRYAPRALP